MKTRYMYLIFLAGLMATAGCGGSGDTTGGARTITGSLALPETSLSQSRTLITCLADTVLATDTEGTTVTETVSEDCAFEVSLTIGKSYVISFALNGEFVATLVFDSGITGFASSSLSLADGENAIDLGVVTISGSTASSAKNPLEQNDRDDDGENDLEDEDDDNDDVDDELEEDCDLDGFLDDLDLDSECEEEDDDEMENAGDTAMVLEVKPRNDPHPENGDDRVDLDKEVRARISCEVDSSSVTAETFQVVAESGEAIACAYEFSGSGNSGNRIECNHEEDFLADTIYQATLDGVMCEDGRMVEARTWQWLTEEADDDEGDAEDEIDEEDEEDDEDEDGDEEDDADEDDDEDDDEDEED